MTTPIVPEILFLLVDCFHDRGRETGFGVLLCAASGDIGHRLEQRRSQADMPDDRDPFQ